jgi:hypothetical protein
MSFPLPNLRMAKDEVKLEEQNVEISELEKRLPSVFWDVRNKVIHLGYSPTYSELETLTAHIGKVLGHLEV